MPAELRGVVVLREALLDDSTRVLVHRAVARSVEPARRRRSLTSQ